jgi:hypothetical protein
MRGRPVRSFEVGGGYTSLSGLDAECGAVAGASLWDLVNGCILAVLVAGLDTVVRGGLAVGTARDGRRRNGKMV